MRDYKILTYDYIDKKTGIHTVKAVTRYEGKSVYAFAKCDPNDGFDLEFGKKLAIKRLKASITRKRAAYIKEHIKFYRNDLEAIEFERKRIKKELEKLEVSYSNHKVTANALDNEIKELIANI